MYTEHNQTKKNKKALLLLLVLGVFGVVAFKYTKVKDIKASDSNTEAATCATDVVDNSYESNAIFLNMDENGAITDVTPTTGSVLGTDSVSNCKIGSKVYSGQSACILENAKSRLSVNGKKYVSADAQISMTSITAPIWVLIGSFNVQDSNGKLTNENQYIPPAGGVNKDLMIERTTAPGVLHDEVVAGVIEGAVKNEAYSVKYTISTGAKNGSDNLTINKYAENNCGELCNNEANSNPDKSNKSSKYLENSLYSYPGQEEEEVPTTLQIDGICENTDTADVLGVPACVNTWALITGTISSLFPSSDWTKCSASVEDNDDGCIKAETIAVKISPMLKETNSFTEKRVKTAMDPESSSIYETVYLITRCQANVAGVSTPVNCIWDMSYLFNERKAAEFDDVGGSDTPTVEQYKAILKKESTSRPESDLISM